MQKQGGALRAHGYFFNRKDIGKMLRAIVWAMNLTSCGRSRLLSRQFVADGIPPGDFKPT